MKTFELVRPLGAPTFVDGKLNQNTEFVASVMAQNVSDAIQKFQYEACITMHVIFETEEGADVDIPQRNANWGWDMAYIAEAK